LFYDKTGIENWRVLPHDRDLLGSVVGVVAGYRGNLKFEHQQGRKNHNISVLAYASSQKNIIFVCFVL
jgi:hypothetical protein